MIGYKGKAKDTVHSRMNSYLLFSDAEIRKGNPSYLPPELE